MFNLIQDAMSIIPTETIELIYNNRGLDEYGNVTITPQTIINLQASVQRVSYKDIELRGLSVTKEYRKFIIMTSESILNDATINWNGNTYNIISNDDWQTYAGWCRLIGVRR